MQNIQLCGGIHSFELVSSDTAVVVIDVVVFYNSLMRYGCIWKGQRLRWIPIHDIIRSMVARPNALSFLHSHVVI